MKKIKLLPRSVIFYKLYLCNILITVVFICLIAVVCSTFSSRLILDNLIDFNELRQKARHWMSGSINWIIPLT